MVNLFLLVWIFLATTIEVEGGKCKKEAACWKKGGTCYPWNEAPSGSTAFMKGKKPFMCGKECVCYDAGQSEIVITGGAVSAGSGNTDRNIDGVEFYPPICPANSLPNARGYHVTFKTNFPNLVTCGGTLTGGLYGEPTNSCIVFSKATNPGEWVPLPGKVDNLKQKRILATAVTLNNGVYVLGGETPANTDPYSEIHTSEYLPNGVHIWQHGPVIPGFGSQWSCSVAISPFSFLLIGGGDSQLGYSNQVLEYHHPSDSWTTWTPLITPRRSTGCAKIGQKVVVAGGYNNGAVLDSTEIIDLTDKSKTPSPGGPLNTTLHGHGMLTVGYGAFEKILAFGGYTSGWYSSATTDVFEWDDSTDTWSRTTPDLDSPKGYFGSVPVQPEMICG